MTKCPNTKHYKKIFIKGLTEKISMIDRYPIECRTEQYQSELRRVEA
jgi:hypothetical protein